MEQYANNASTTLNGAINNSVTSLTVTSATGFPTAGDFRIRIDTEILIVTGVSGTTFTVTRGAEGTSAGSHASGASIFHILTRDSLLNLAGTINRYGLLGSRPTAAYPGRIYYPTDAPYPQYDTGSAWRNMHKGRVLDVAIPVSATLLSGSWSWLNQGSATLTDTNDGFHLVQPTSGGSDEIRGIVKTAPATPYSLVVGVQAVFPFGQYYRAGIFVRDSSGGGLQTFSFTKENSLTNVTVDNYNSVTSYNATVRQMSAYQGQFGFFRIRDNGTDRSFECSVDGVNWDVIHLNTRTTFVTPNQYGIFGSNGNATYSGTRTKVFFLEETSP